MPFIEATAFELERRATQQEAENSSRRTNIGIAVFLAIFSFVAIVITAYLVRKLLINKSARSKPISKPIPNVPGTSFATLFSTFRPFQGRGRSNSDSDAGNMAPGYGNYGNGNFAKYPNGSGSISSVEEGGPIRSVENDGATSIRTNMVSIDTSTYKRHFAPNAEGGNGSKSVLQRNSTGNSRQYNYSRTPTTASTRDQQRQSRLSKQFANGGYGPGEYGPQSAIPDVPPIRDYSDLYNASVIKSPVTSTMAIAGGNRNLTRRSLPPARPLSRTVPVSLFTKIPPTPQSEYQRDGDVGAVGVGATTGGTKPGHKRQGSSSAPADMAIQILSDATNRGDPAYQRSVSEQGHDQPGMAGMGGMNANNRAGAKVKFESTGYAINSFIDAYINNEEQTQPHQPQSRPQLPIQSRFQRQLQSESESESVSQSQSQALSQTQSQLSQSPSPPPFRYSEQRQTRVMVAMGATVASGQVQRLPIISEKPQLLQAPQPYIAKPSNNNLTVGDGYGYAYSGTSGNSVGTFGTDNTVGSLGVKGIDGPNLQYTKPPMLPEIRRIAIESMHITEAMNTAAPSTTFPYPPANVNNNTRGTSAGSSTSTNSTSSATSEGGTRKSRQGHLRTSSRKERPASIIVPSGITRPDVIISVSPGPGAFVIDE